MNVRPYEKNNFVTYFLCAYFIVQLTIKPVSHFRLDSKIICIYMIL